jgi:hypothetical protein
MEKQETHAPHHDENQKTHAPPTMPCACTGYGEPLPRLPINTGRKDKKKRGENFWRVEGSKLQKRGRKGEEKGKRRGRRASCRNGKKGKPEGAKLLRNELEGRNKFEKGDRGGLQRSINRGGVFGSKVRKQNHPFRVPSSYSSLSTVAFGHHHPAPPFRHHQRCHQQQQRRNRNKTEKEKEQEREQKQRGSKAQRKGDHHLHQRSHRLLLQHDCCVSAPREEESQGFPAAAAASHQRQQPRSLIPGNLLPPLLSFFGSASFACRT